MKICSLAGRGRPSVLSHGGGGVWEGRTQLSFMSPVAMWPKDINMVSDGSRHHRNHMALDGNTGHGTSTQTPVVVGPFLTDGMEHNHCSVSSRVSKKTLTAAISCLLEPGQVSRWDRRLAIPANNSKLSRTPQTNPSFCELYQVASVDNRENRYVLLKPLVY